MLLANGQQERFIQEIAREKINSLPVLNAGRKDKYGRLPFKDDYKSEAVARRLPQIMCSIRQLNHFFQGRER